MKPTCPHVAGVNRQQKPNTKGCEECLKLGQPWVHLRVCLTCGHVGCCDSSIGNHATKHYLATKHPMMRSLERGEDWGWCYVDDTFFEPFLNG